MTMRKQVLEICELCDHIRRPIKDFVITIKCTVSMRRVTGYDEDSSVWERGTGWVPPGARHVWEDPFPACAVKGMDIVVGTSASPKARPDPANYCNCA